MASMRGLKTEYGRMDPDLIDAGHDNGPDRITGLLDVTR
jgi:hypothetical protein